VYRPEAGDEVWQVPPGTAFEALPDEWRCPRCDSGKERFLPTRDDDTRGGPAQGDSLSPRVAALVADYQDIQRTKMKDLPLNNPRLEVEAVDFQPLGDGALGALVTPWCINAVFLPPAGAPTPTARGHERALPAGRVTFFPQHLPTCGDVELASLFSPALDFEDHAAAVATAREALALLRTSPAAPAPAQRSRREFFDGLRARAHTR
jgi:[NiFe] hydrogenase assembly HybE family chaperone